MSLQKATLLLLAAASTVYAQSSSLGVIGQATSKIGSALGGGSSTASASSTSSATATPTQTEHPHHGITGGKIAGIVIGVVVGGLLLLTLALFCCCRGVLKNRKDRKALRDAHDGGHEPKHQTRREVRPDNDINDQHPASARQPTTPALEKGNPHHSGTQQVPVGTYQTPATYGNEATYGREGNFDGAGTNRGGVSQHSMQMANNPSSTAYGDMTRNVVGAGGGNGNLFGNVPSGLKASDIAGVPSTMGRTAGDVSGMGKGGSGRVGGMATEAESVATKYSTRN